MEFPVRCFLEEAIASKEDVVPQGQMHTTDRRVTIYLVADTQLDQIVGQIGTAEILPVPAEGSEISPDAHAFHTDDHAVAGDCRDRLLELGIVVDMQDLLPQH
ncbi:hypothetical protein OAO01_03760 [Oligoflexia bacterium]|nr:hypothetical protein [Oligoflexia bacterium]